MEPVLLGEREVDWGVRLRIRLYQSDQLPPTELTTASFAIVPRGNSLLMARLIKRGWDLPGGKIDPGEDALIAAVRETREETGVHIDTPIPLGYERMDLLDPTPAGYKFPAPTAFQTFTLAVPLFQGTIVSTDEAFEAAFLSPERAARTKWVRDHRPLYDLAIEQSLFRKSLSD